MIYSELGLQTNLDVYRPHRSRRYDSEPESSFSSSNWLEQSRNHEDLPAYGCSLVEFNWGIYEEIYEDDPPYSMYMAE